MISSIENFVDMFFGYIFIPRNTNIKEHVVSSDSEQEEECVTVVNYNSD